MDKLNISLSRESQFFNFWKITGFSIHEMLELKKLYNEKGYYEFKNRVLEIVDEHNPGQGTAWNNGYGVYGVFFGTGDNEDAIYVETGNSCD